MDLELEPFSCAKLTDSWAGKLKNSRDLPSVGIERHRLGGLPGTDGMVPSA